MEACGCQRFSPAADSGRGEPFAEFLSYAIFASAEKMSVATEFRAAKHLEHEVGAGHALYRWMALMTPDPDGWHAIWRHESSTAEDLCEIAITVGFHDSMYAAMAYITLALAAQIVCDPREGLLHVDGIDADAEYVYFRVFSRYFQDRPLSMGKTGGKTGT